MAKKDERVQVLLSSDSRAWIDGYMTENALTSMSKACAELIEFAIRIKSRAEDDTSISNRTLLEELLQSNYRMESIVKRNYLNVYSEDNDNNLERFYVIKDKIEKLTTSADKKATDFINNGSGN